MNQKGIDDGDLVLIEQTEVPCDGQIVAALINDEATLKEFRHEGDLAYLIPHSDNPRHKPIILGEFSDNFSRYLCSSIPRKPICVVIYIYHFTL